MKRSGQILASVSIAGALAAVAACGQNPHLLQDPAALEEAQQGSIPRGSEIPPVRIPEPAPGPDQPAPVPAPTGETPASEPRVIVSPVYIDVPGPTIIVYQPSPVPIEVPVIVTVPGPGVTGPTGPTGASAAPAIDGTDGQVGATGLACADDETAYYEASARVRPLYTDEAAAIVLPYRTTHDRRDVPSSRRKRLYTRPLGELRKMDSTDNKFGLVTDASGQNRYPWVQNSQVPFAVELTDIPPHETLVNNGLEYMDLAIELTKVGKERNYLETEILCLLNEKICSGYRVGESRAVAHRDASWSSTFNPDFWGARGPANPYFGDNLAAREVGRVSGGDKVFFLEGRLPFAELIRGSDVSHPLDLIYVSTPPAGAGWIEKKILYFAVGDDTIIDSLDTKLEIKFRYQSCRARKLRHPALRPAPVVAPPVEVPPVAALARGPASVSLQTLQPTANSSYVLTEDALLRTAPMNPSWTGPRLLLGVQYNLLDDALVELNAKRTERTAVVVDAIHTLDISAAVSVRRQLTLALLAPLNLQKATGSAERFGLGDFRVLTKWRLSDDDALVAWTLIPEVRLPTGSRELLLSNGSWGAGLLVAVERDFGDLIASANFGYRHTPGARMGGMDFRNQIPLALGAYLPFSDTWAMNVEAGGAISFPIDQYNNPGELYLGARHQASREVSLVAGFSIGSLSDRGSGDVRFVAGVRFAPTPEPALPDVRPVAPVVVAPIAAPVVQDKIQSHRAAPVKIAKQAPKKKLGKKRQKKALALRAERPERHAPITIQIQNVNQAASHSAAAHAPDSAAPAQPAPAPTSALR